jgi:hypothetical protein
MRQLHNHKQLVFVFIFILIITGLSLSFQYPATLLKRPQSVHTWRQCDGLSLAQCYYQEGMHFFKPQTHMMYSDHYTSGYTAPSEVPILYYFVAILYKIFGYHEFIYRAVNLLIFFTGLLFLFKLAYAVLNDWFYAIIVLILISSSPVLIYYGNNFLPNTTALAFTFIGWYYFYRYAVHNKTSTFLVSMIFFALAAMLKITDLAGVLIILALLIADRVGLICFGLNKDKHFGGKLAAVAGIFLLVGGWVFYAKYYNARHGSEQFMSYIVPIWDMTRSSIQMNLHKMHDIWFKEYYYPVTFYFMLACFLVMIVFYKRSSKIILTASLTLTGGLVVYSLLWFLNLGDHDYFYIWAYILPALLFINFFLIMKSLPLKKIPLKIIQTVFILFALMNVIYGAKRHALRYHLSWMNDYNENISLYHIKPWIEKNGITRSDSVLFYPSLYVRPLYFMNRKGWVLPYREDINEQTMKNDSLFLKNIISSGARYMITNRIEQALHYRPLQPYLKDLKCRDRDLYIFRIPPEKSTFQTDDTLNSKQMINTP